MDSGSVEAAEASDQSLDDEKGGFGSLGVAVGALVVVWCAVLASFPLKDNSFLTHLATGRIILDTGSVPSADPYTFTVPGIDWTVQSWLASVVYAGAERAGGDVGLRLLVLTIFIVAALFLWRLSRPAESIVVRIGLVFAALIVATDTWSERPYMVGVVGIAIVWLALEGSVRPWVLVPLLWVWANTHGSFPFAIGLIVTVIAGSMIDQLRHRAEGETGFELATELAVLKATLLGSVLAVIGPLGLRVLTFPVKGLTRSDVLADIVEWKAPAFTSVPQRVFLLLILCAMAALVRSGRWRLALPALAFTALALIAQRNIVMALMVLVPVIAEGAPRLGTLTSSDRPRLGPVLTVLSVVLVAVVVVTSLSGSVTSLEPYPERAVAWVGMVDEDRAAGNLAAPDFVGNLFEVLDGPRGEVFVDDRADMFPPDFFADSRALARGEARWHDVLDDHDIQVLVWPRSSSLTSLVAADDRWQVVFADLDSIAACRRGPACATIGR